MDYKENTESRKGPSSIDEIDLSKLFTAIGKGISQFFKGIFRLFFLFIDTAISKFKIILALTIIGALAGFAYYLQIKSFYESRMTLSSAYYQGQFLNNSIKNLDRLCNEGNYRVLSNLLNINQAKAKTFKSMEVEKMISPNLQMLINIYKNQVGGQRKIDSMILNHNDSTFQIKVQVYDTTSLVGLDTVLVNYIKNNEFVNKRIAIERKNLLNRKAKLIRESKNLDTLKSNIAKSYIATGLGKEGTNVTLNDKETDPINIYREDFRIYEQQLKIDRLLYINSEIEIIDSFITFGKPASETLDKQIIKGILGGLVLAFLYIFFLILRTGLRKFRQIVYQP